jgi:hypothetical protein
LYIEDLHATKNTASGCFVVVVVVVGGFGDVFVIVDDAIAIAVAFFVVLLVVEDTFNLAMIRKVLSRIN